MEDVSIVAQLRFIDDAVHAAPRGLKIFACSDVTLDSLTKIKFIGGYKPRIVTSINQYPTDHRVCAKYGDTGFDIIDTRRLPLDLCGQLLTRAKDWILPNIYDNNLFLAVTAKHRVIDQHPRGAQLEYCCIDMNDAQVLAAKRKEYNFR